MRSITTAFGAVLGCAMLLVQANEAAAAQQLSRIVVAYQPGDANSQGIIKEKGWFSEVDGVKVEYKDFSSGADVYRAMASGAIDFGLIGNAPFTIAVTQGAAYKAAWWYDIGLTAEGLVVRTTSPIHSVADLKGHKVATPFGSTADYMLHGTLKTAALNGVKLINLSPQAILAAWHRGDIDAAYIWAPVLGQLTEQGGKVLVFDKDLLKNGYLAGDVGAVKASLLQEHPDVVRAWMKANVRAMDLIKNNPEEAYRSASRAYGTTVDEIRTYFRGDLFPTGTEQLGPDYLGGLGDQLHRIAQLLAAEGLIPAAADPDVYKAAVTLEPLKDALAH